jgi:hypothetical protein
MHSRKELSSLILLVLVVTLGGAVLSAATPSAPRDQRTSLLLSVLRNSYTSAQLENGVYVGSEFCIACHSSLTPEVVQWHGTEHSFFIRKPMAAYTLQAGKGVMANSLGGPQDDFIMGLDFNTMTGTPFDSLKPNAPVLSYDAPTDQYYMRLGPNGLKLLVASTLAGQGPGNGQRFMVRIPVADTATGWSNAVYFGPAAWGGMSWTSNAASWYTGATPNFATGVRTSDLGLLQGQNYMKNCMGCHMTGIRQVVVPPDPNNGEFLVRPYPAVLVPQDSPDYPDMDGDGLPDLMNIGCESCHGPGSAHILGGGDPAKIVNPADIANNQQRAETCLQCHVQIASAPNQTWGFTFDDANNMPFIMSNPPEPLDSYQVFTGGKWPDGVNYVYARIDSFKSSAHYQGAHGIACNDCHNPHSVTTNDAQARDTITSSGVADIPSIVDDDSFCLACHATHGPFATLTKSQIKDWDANFVTIRGVIEAHTNHPYGAPRMLGLSRCTTCHMAPMAGHGTIEGFSHSFLVARPEDTIALADAPGTGNTFGATGNVNSCSASCHRGKVIIWPDVPANLTPNDNKFNTPNELLLASHLVQYYGPGGKWWDTAPSEVTAAAHKRRSSLVRR